MSCSDIRIIHPSNTLSRTYHGMVQVLNTPLHYVLPKKSIKLAPTS